MTALVWIGAALVSIFALVVLACYKSPHNEDYRKDLDEGSTEEPNKWS
jgi:hypothetical protein